MKDSEAGTSGAVTEDYDVFLNHRGPDVKSTFVAHLEDALRCAGFRPFLDARSLMKGNPALKSIDQALDMAKVHVAVVSRRYAESKYCLNELVAMMRSGKPVIPVFYDVEPVDLRCVENGPFADAFEKHKLRGRTEKRVQEWRDALQKLADLTGFRLADFKSDEAKLKREVVNEVARFTPSNQPIEVERYRVGLEGPINSCIEVLENMGAGVGMLSLVGMGGVGKTSLAREIYNHFVDQKTFRWMTFLEIHRDPSSSDVHVRPTRSGNLREQLLWDLLRVQDTTANYSSWFQKVSTLGPVLIVIDDVHSLGQFEALVPSLRVLHPGSRIIITSRDRSVLNNVAERSKIHHHLYDVSTLAWNESNTLFNWHAFSAKEAPEDYKDIAKDVVRACGGLPLALKVIGSSLSDKRLDGDRETIWPEAIEALRQSRDVMGVLRWSYDSLPESEQLMFLDITCLFYDESVKEAFAYWEGCKNCTSFGGIQTPHMSLRNLNNKNLVVVQDVHSGVFRVHDLLRDLGQEIAMKVGRHFVDDRFTEAAFMENEGLVKTIGLNLTGSRKRKFEVENFASIPNLHLLRLPDGCHLNGDFGPMPKKLRLLQWRGMPLRHIPVGLNLSLLTSLDFSSSTNLASLWTESSNNLKGYPNLLRLTLKGCKSITKLPNSIGQSLGLQHLNLNYCERLKKLPISIGQLRELERLHLRCCWSLKALPDTIAYPNLLELDLFLCSSITKLPDSLGQSSRLQHLNLEHCRKLKELPKSIGQLNILKHFSLNGCASLEVLPNTIAYPSLVRLDLTRCPCITMLPDSIEQSSQLQHLILSYCENLKKLPDFVGQLKALQSLELRGCLRLKTLPNSISALSNLENLDILGCTSLVKLSSSIGLLLCLPKLQIGATLECQTFSDGNVGELWTRLESLALSNWGGFGSLLNYGALQSLGKLEICDTTLIELPESIELLSRLLSLEIQCERLQCLPKAIGDYKMLKTLRLEHCDNLRTLPETLGTLTSLTHLSIECCFITELPRSVGDLSRLSSLEITSERFQCLPKSIGDFRMLKTLRLERCNNLRTLPETLDALTSLTHLSIECCPIGELPRSIGDLSRLSLLRINSERLQCLPKSIGDLKMLKTLVLKHCDNLRRLPKTLGALTSLEHLDIWYCPIKKLPRSAGLLPQLSYLRLEGCKNLQKLPTSIRQLKSLKGFGLVDCGSIEAMGVLTTLQGLPIWGSTSITTLPASLATVSTLVVYEGESIPCHASSLLLSGTFQVLEEDESGFLRAYQDKSSGVTGLLRGLDKKEIGEQVFPN